MTHHICQACLFALSTAAIWLVGCKGPVRRWGYVCGVASEPFWVWTAWHAEQWGVLVLCVIYAVGWARGAYNHWKPEEPV